jgi:hypothetical protein
MSETPYTEPRETALPGRHANSTVRYGVQSLATTARTRELSSGSLRVVAWPWSPPTRCGTSRRPEPASVP